MSESQILLLEPSAVDFSKLLLDMGPALAFSYTCQDPIAACALKASHLIRSTGQV